MAPLHQLEAEALLEHDFRCKKCAVPSREGLSSGKIPVGRRVCDTWYKCGPRTPGDDLCSPPLPPMGLSHGPPVGTTYILPFWGGPDQRHSG